MFDTRRKRGRDTESTHDGATVLRFVCHLGYMEIVRYLHRVSASAITSDGAQALPRARVLKDIWKLCSISSKIVISMQR